VKEGEVDLTFSFLTVTCQLERFDNLGICPTVNGQPHFSHSSHPEESIAFASTRKRAPVGSTIHAHPPPITQTRIKHATVLVQVHSKCSVALLLVRPLSYGTLSNNPRRFTNAATDKSGKKFAPKAVRRRAAAGTEAHTPSTAGSARPSVEPQPSPLPTQDGPEPSTQADGPSAATPDTLGSTNDDHHASSSWQAGVTSEQSVARRRSISAAAEAGLDRQSSISSRRTSVDDGERQSDRESETGRQSKRRRLESPNITSSSASGTSTALRPSVYSQINEPAPTSLATIPDLRVAPTEQSVEDVVYERRSSWSEAAAATPARRATPVDDNITAIPQPHTTAGASSGQNNIKRRGQTASKQTKAKGKELQEAPAGADEETRQDDAAPSTSKPRKARKERAATKNRIESSEQPADASQDGEESRFVIVHGPSTTSSQSTPKRKTTQARRSKASEEASEAQVEGEGADGDGATQVQRKRRGRQRAPTPEEAESMTVNTVKDTMASITKDRRIGRKSEREKQMRTIDWDDVQRKRREERKNARPRRREPTPGKQAKEQDPNAVQDGGDAAQSAFPSSSSQQHAQVRLVNGVMVTDESTLVIDRRAALHSNNATLEMVEESDLTARLNNHSWINANKRDVGDDEPLYTPTDRWSAAQTDAFYEALRMFGTDFAIISNMFPGRTRRNIKHKFVKEERANPARIKAALSGEKLAMDFQTYLSNTGQQESDFKDPRALEEELRQEDERHKAEVEDAKKQYEETQRQRKLAEGNATDGDGAGAHGPESAKENASGARKGRKKKRGKNETRGGEEVVILGTIVD
jgi:transcription factor TFIIIB component B''